MRWYLLPSERNILEHAFLQEASALLENRALRCTDPEGAITSLVLTHVLFDFKGFKV